MNRAPKHKRFHLYKKTAETVLPVKKDENKNDIFTIELLAKQFSSRKSSELVHFNEPYIIIPSSPNDVGTLPHTKDSLRHLFDRTKNTNDDVNYLNKYICELTSLYYLVNHIDSKIIGLEHYRRCFTNDGVNFLTKQQIEIELEKTDVLVYNWGLTHQQHIRDRNIWYWLSHNMNFFGATQDDFLYFLNTITDGDVNFLNFVNEYYNNTLMAPPNNTCKLGFIACLMFIGKQEIIKKWADFVFSGIERIFTVDNYIKHRKLFNDRIIGYYYEYLFGAWLNYNHINFKAIPVRSPN